MKNNKQPLQHLDKSYTNKLVILDASVTKLNSRGGSVPEEGNDSSGATSEREKSEEEGEEVVNQDREDVTDDQEREVVTESKESEVLAEAQYIGQLVDEVHILEFIPDRSFDESIQTSEEETQSLQSRNRCNCGICVQCEGIQLGHHTKPITDVLLIGNNEFPIEFLFSRK
ncbi:unnamed protein product [Mytilus edulis]|uniref:Uncharacterized protein n=1 Tax=Mytilus edulis TaxID=6550 RepID=A0A8S3TAF1_MYTED|nr:unnamed protein product [Mytilus edulis]